MPGRRVTPTAGSLTAGGAPAGMADAVLRTVAYADVFDFARRIDEIHRDLIGVAASRADVERTLAGDKRLRGRVEQHDGHVVLAGRGGLLDRRRERAARTAALWPLAVAHGRTIGSLPFVRMVAVTGAVAVGNPEDDADIDYFVVTDSGRVWTARALTIGVVRTARRSGVELCPNYLISEEVVALDERDLFTAHELAQMVPLVGMDTYRRMRDENPWVAHHLPNASGPPPTSVTVARRWGRVRRGVEAALRSGLGDRLERVERERKIARLSAGATDTAEVRFGPQVCKGHFTPYGRRVMDAYADRLERLGEPPP
jgi:hypothetical protein